MQSSRDTVVVRINYITWGIIAYDRVSVVVFSDYYFFDWLYFMMQVRPTVV